MCVRVCMRLCACMLVCVCVCTGGQQLVLDVFLFRPTVFVEQCFSLYLGHSDSASLDSLEIPASAS